MRPPRNRRALTLTELLVVIAIIALAVTLLIPGMHRGGGSRNAALKNSCRNNMRQLALALQNYPDYHKTFPPLYFSNDPAVLANPELNPAEAVIYYTWQTRLLPYLEEETLYKTISQNSGKFTMPSAVINVPVVQGNATAPGFPSKIRLNQLECPSNPFDLLPAGVSNYAALSSTRLPLLLNVAADSDGVPAYKQEPDGMLIPEKTQRGYPMSRMADGTSKTAVLIESLETARSNWYNPQESFVVGFPPADSTPIDAAASNYYPYFAPPQAGTVAAPAPSRWQFNPAAGNRTALAAHDGDEPKVPYHPLKGDPLERTWGPSSAHRGGIIIVGMGDGSVHEITPDIDPAVFFAAITARGGEAVRAINADD